MKPGRPPQRKAPLARGDGLSRGAGLNRSAGLARNGGLDRGAGPDRKSERRKAEDVTRYDVLFPNISREPCRVGPGIRAVVPEYDGCRKWAEHLHERRKAGAGGSRVNPANVAPSCDTCNGWLEDHPPEGLPAPVMLTDGRSAVVREGDPDWDALSKRNDRMSADDDHDGPPVNEDGPLPSAEEESRDAGDPGPDPEPGEWVELTGDAIPYHLRPNAPALAVCSGCARSTWSTEEVGTVCRMTQPTGQPCGGTMLAREFAEPGDTDGRSEYGSTTFAGLPTGDHRLDAPILPPNVTPTEVRLRIPGRGARRVRAEWLAEAAHLIRTEGPPAVMRWALDHPDRTEALEPEQGIAADRIVVDEVLEAERFASDLIERLAQPLHVLETMEDVGPPLTPPHVDTRPWSPTFGRPLPPFAEQHYAAGAIPLAITHAEVRPDGTLEVSGKMSPETHAAITAGMLHGVSIDHLDHVANTDGPSPWDATVDQTTMLTVPIGVLRDAHAEAIAAAHDDGYADAAADDEPEHGPTGLAAWPAFLEHLLQRQTM